MATAPPARRPDGVCVHWLHRLLHHHTLCSAYHSHHHASFVTEPITGSVHPFMEHLMYTANFAIPLLGTWAFGGASIAMFYAYLLGFDLLNNIGHCNFEFIPRWFMNLPLMKYLIYTPSYHSLHHSKVHTNFCLFMPLYDYAYGTADANSHDLYERAMRGEAAPNAAADVVFVAHGTELLSLFHLPFALRSFSSRPFKSEWWLQPFLPLTLPLVACLRVFGAPFVADKHRLLHLNCATWVTPAWGFQFFIKSEFGHINRKIEQAILAADRAGTKVIGLGALNKNEALNGGGQKFVDEHPELNVRVVHGNTLTAAAILRKMPSGVKDFSHRRHLEAGSRDRAVHVRAGRQGGDVHHQRGAVREDQERGGARTQALAVASRLSVGGRRHQRLGGRKALLRRGAADRAETRGVPPVRRSPIPETRKDCVYTDLPAFALPAAAKDFRSCEMTMERGHVHACHAGALVHALEGGSTTRWGRSIHADRRDVGRRDETRLRAGVMRRVRAIRRVSSFYRRDFFCSRRGDPRERERVGG